ncbi:hypothetical protein ACIPUB_02305 [Paeniglutamicibacter sp. ORCA_105]
MGTAREDLNRRARLRDAAIERFVEHGFGESHNPFTRVSWPR